MDQYSGGEPTFLNLSFMKTWDVHFINNSSVILFTKFSYKKNREKLAPLLNIDSLSFSALLLGNIHPHQQYEMQHFISDRKCSVTFYCLVKTPGLIITPTFLSELFQILKTCLIITPPLVQKILLILFIFFHLFFGTHKV